MWELWKKQFLKEMKSFISHNMHTPGKAKHSRSPPWFNNDIRRLVCAKNRLFKRACSSGSQMHWEVYRRARNETTKAIKKAKSIFLHKQAQTLADSSCPPSKWWRVAKNLSGFSDKTPFSIPPLMTNGP